MSQLNPRQREAVCYMAVDASWQIARRDKLKAIPVGTAHLVERIGLVVIRLLNDLDRPTSGSLVILAKNLTLPMAPGR